MAILEWKKFDFFNLCENADKGKLSDAVRDAEINCSTSGKSQKIVCDSLGRIHIFYRNWDCISFSGHDVPINFCVLSQNNILITIASRDNEEPSTFKVWNLSKVTKRNGAPCLKTVKCIIQKPTSVAISEIGTNGLLLAIGFERGELSLYKGDINRDFGNSFTALTIGTRPITGIAFKQSGRFIHMFVCSHVGVLVYTINGFEKETKVVLDKTYAPTRCCALQVKSSSETYFMVGRDDAVYCYTTDGRGPCYALEGQKVLIEWFGNYLVTVLKSNKNVSSQQKEYNLIVIDIQNRFIVFTTPIEPVVAILNEFGTCYIVTKSKQIYHIYEKDLQSKLQMLFKKNLFDIAIRISKEQEYDAEGLANIYKLYGDHLYIKGNYAGCVEKYIKTIKYVEPSYVIKKFLDTRHINYLAQYLQGLAKEGLANEEHKILLLNCINRLGLPKKLDDFLLNDDNPVNLFDLNDALQTQTSIEVLPDLTRKEFDLNALLKKDYKEIFEYSRKLPLEEAEIFFKKYGLNLIHQCPKKATMLFKMACFNITDEADILEANTIVEPAEVINPELFIPFFFQHNDELVDFLEHIISNLCNCSKTIYNTIIELYLRKWEPNDKQSETRLLEILRVHDGLYDKEQTLILCRTFNFWPGILWLYEEEKLYNLTIRYYLKNSDYDNLLNCCKNLGKYQPHLWVQALNGLHNDENAPMNVLLQILNVINTEKLQSPLQTMQCLALNPGPNFGHLRDYYLQSFQKSSESVKHETIEVEKLQNDLRSLQDLLNSFGKNPLQFRSTACDACNQPLTIPSVYFLCQHSFHQDCIRSYSENEKDCSICSVRNAQLMEILKNPHEEQNQHESFHSILDRSNDVLQVLSTYFGRGLFNKIVIVDEPEPETEPKSKSKTIPATKFEAKTNEIKPIFNESRPAPSYVNKYNVVSKNKPSSSRNVMASAYSKPMAPVPTIATSKNSVAVKHTKGNPFEEDDDDFYDNSKNPFAEKTVPQKSTNPFEE